MTRGGNVATKTRLPETLSAVQVAQRLAGTTASAATDMATKPSDSRMLRALSLDAGQPAAAAAHRAIEAANANRDDELDGSTMTLNVEDIGTYDKDPRTGKNPKYDEIKASFLSQGNHHRFAVTRRPGESQYFVAAGGNTRLRIIKELWETTQDKRWKTLDVVYRKWRGETNVIVAHLAENEARADTTFWEKAQGIGTLRAELQAERPDAAVTASDIAEALRKAGMERGLKYVQTVLFTIDSVRPLGPFIGFKAVYEGLAPAYRQLVRLCTSLDVGSAPQILEDTMQMQADQLADQLGAGQDSESADPTLLIQGWRAAIARQLGVPADKLVAMLTALQENPRTPPSVLLAIGRGESVATLDGRPALAPAPAAAPVAPRQPAPAAQQAAPAQQGLLQPILSPVALPSRPEHGAASTAAGSGNSDLPTVASVDGPLPSHVAPHQADAYRVGVLEYHVEAQLAKLMQMAELDGLIIPEPACPLGFWVEPPRKGWEFNFGGGPVRDPDLRMATWLFLATVSGQFDRAVVARLTTDHHVCQWRAMVEEGHLRSYLVDLMGDEHGDWSVARVASGELTHRALLDPVVGPALLELLSLSHRQRAFQPPRWIDAITDNVAASADTHL